MKSNQATIGRLLRRNMSKTQLVGFIVSNFIGLAIVIAAIQFYADIRPIWEDNESFINSDYIVVNKRVSASNTLGTGSTSFSEDEIADISAQPWLRRLGVFRSADYEVRASMQQGDRGMSTSMFLESVPDGFIDVDKGEWHFSAADSVVPVILSKDYLTLYNFGFASSAGMPQLTEGLISSIPLKLRLRPRTGEHEMTLDARIVGFSGRLNTILVPEEFIVWSNSLLGSGGGNAAETESPRRLIIEVNSPGDVAISDYLDAHGLERAGSSESGRASFFLRLVAGLIIAIGALITFMSLFILMLSVALLMQRNRAKVHSLIMLGYPLRAVGRPFRRIILLAGVASYALAVVAMLVFRNIYISGIEALASDKAGVAVSLLCGAGLVVATVVINFIAINRRVHRAFR